MIKYFSQIDPRWSRQTIGSTALTVYDWGCTLTSTCNVIKDFYNDKDVITPYEAAKLWKYNNVGEIIWSGIRFKELKFIVRGSGRISHKTASEALSRKQGVLLRLAYNPRHWVKLHKWTKWYIPWFLCVDPYTYNPILKCARIVKKWKRSIDGYALFEKM